MGFGYDNNSAYSMRGEPVDRNGPNLGSCNLGSLNQYLLNFLNTGVGGAVAALLWILGAGS